MLEKLVATRASVDGFKLTPQESVVYFTQTIASYLDVIAQITILSRNPDITREAMAYHAYLSVIFRTHSPTWFSHPFTQARRAELVR
jgi:hypothetical protein